MLSGCMATFPAVIGLPWILPAVFPPLMMFPDARQENRQKNRLQYTFSGCIQGRKTENKKTFLFN